MNIFMDTCTKKKLCDVTEPPAFRVPGDMYNQEGEDEEPEWVTTERQQFTEFRDQNKDGKMDKHETRDWILPKDYDHAEAEAKHLIYEADKDEVWTLNVLGFALLLFFLSLDILYRQIQVQ